MPSTVSFRESKVEMEDPKTKITIDELKCCKQVVDLPFRYEEDVSNTFAFTEEALCSVGENTKKILLLL
jgi:hypothetical protein